MISPVMGIFIEGDGKEVFIKLFQWYLEEKSD